MTYNHDAGRLHRQELDREIEAIRAEQTVTADGTTPGLVERTRRRTGYALLAAGRALVGPEPRPMKAFDA